jgi:heme oxygenase
MLSSELHPQTSSKVKDRTSSLHQELESLLIPELQTIRSADEYERILQWFYGFIFPLENSIEQKIKPQILPDIAERKKSQLILQDLVALGSSITDIPINHDLPNIQHQEHAIGAMYVLEGSTLGGKIIANMLTKNAASFKNSIHYFTAYGKETGSKWRIFLEHMNQYQSTAQVETIIETANETFLKFRNWIRHNQHTTK